MAMPLQAPITGPDGKISREWREYFRALSGDDGGSSTVLIASSSQSTGGSVTDAATLTGNLNWATLPVGSGTWIANPLVYGTLGVSSDVSVGGTINGQTIGPATSLTGTLDVTGRAAFKSHTDFSEVAAPANPAASTLRLWALSAGGFGQLHFKNSAGLDYQLARDNIHTVRNNSGATIPLGAWVYINGSSGVFPTVALAKADSNATMPVAGIVTAAIPNNAFGQIMTHGDVQGLNTSAFSDGSVLYASALVAGGATTTPPAGANIIQRLGVVVKASGGSSGIIAVLIGGELDPGTPQTFSNKTFSDAIGHPDYVSQTSRWRVTGDGAADFRYLYTDELHAKVFIADLEQALAGGQIITKSVALVGAAFTVPNAGAAATLTVRDLPSAENMAVFETGDQVVLRTFSRASGSLTIADAVGVVTGYADLADKLQTWTFTRNAAPNAGAMAGGTVIAVDSLALDFGVSGNGYYEVNAIDGLYGVNSPYAQIVTWATAPVAANRTVRGRFGKLTGITGAADEYGVLAGTYAASDGQYFRASNSAFELHGIDLLLWDGTTNTVKLSRTGPSFALGNPVPSAYGTGTGIWMGKDGTAYKFRVGAPSGNRIAWDGTDITVVSAGITIDGPAGAIRSGATAYGTGAGWWLDYNAGTPRLRVGDPSGNRVAWDGTNITVVSGNVTIDPAQGGIKMVAYTSSDTFNLANGVYWAGTYGTMGIAGYDNGNPLADRTLHLSSTGTRTRIYLTTDGVGASSVQMGYFAGAAKVKIVTGTVEITGDVSASGLLTVSGFGTHSFSAGGSGVNRIEVGQTTSGSDNLSAVQLTIDSGTLVGAITATTTAFNRSPVSAVDPPNVALAVSLLSNTSGGTNIVAKHASGVIRFTTGGTAERQRINADGNLIPAADNTQAVGLAGTRFNLIRGTAVTSGDLNFENDFTFTEGDKLGIPEPGIALLDPDGELVAFFGKSGFRAKGLAGPLDVDDLPYVRTTSVERSEMDAQPEKRVKGTDATGKPIHKTAADVRPMPDPATGRTNKGRR